MKGKFKTALYTILGFLIVVSVVGDTYDDVAIAANTVSGNASNPAILKTVFEFWWIPLILLGVMVMFPTVGRRAKRFFRRSRRRR